jgi:hypothetical protein
MIPGVLVGVVGRFCLQLDCPRPPATKPDEFGYVMVGGLKEMEKNGLDAQLDGPPPSKR